MSERKRRTPDRVWSTRFFENEEKSSPTLRYVPADAPRLKPGDRVSFDVGEGVDGPPFATNVVLVPPAD